MSTIIRYLFFEVQDSGSVLAYYSKRDNDNYNFKPIVFDSIDALREEVHLEWDDLLSRTEHVLNSIVNFTSITELPELKAHLPYYLNQQNIISQLKH